MITRTAKLLLLAGVAFFYSLLVFNNLTDFNSNYQFVHHVLMMDTTFPGSQGTLRALTSSAADYSFYIAIIVWEIVTAILLWLGCLALLRATRGGAQDRIVVVKGSGQIGAINREQILAFFHGIAQPHS